MTVSSRRWRPCAAAQSLACCSRPTPMARPAAGSPTRSRELGGGIGGLRRGLAGGHGLADPAADAVDELLAAGRLSMTHVRYEPEVLGFPGRHVQLAGVLRREV